MEERRAEREREKKIRNEMNEEEDKTTNLALGVFDVSQFCLSILKNLCLSAKSP